MRKQQRTGWRTAQQTALQQMAKVAVTALLPPNPQCQVLIGCSYRLDMQRLLDVTLRVGI